MDVPHVKPPLSYYLSDSFTVINSDPLMPRMGNLHVILSRQRDAMYSQRIRTPTPTFPAFTTVISLGRSYQGGHSLYCE